MGAKAVRKTFAVTQINTTPWGHGRMSEFNFLCNSERSALKLAAPNMAKYQQVAVDADGARQYVAVDFDGMVRFVLRVRDR